tara:strand:+ start:2576 stop:2917 length:342 start_codon:yes stop_codon:yes gene_type:complete
MSDNNKKGIEDIEIELTEGEFRPFEVPDTYDSDGKQRIKPQEKGHDASVGSDPNGTLIYDKKPYLDQIEQIESSQLGELQDQTDVTINEEPVVEKGGKLGDEPPSLPSLDDFA